MDPKENLKDLVSVQGQLLENLDVINEQVKSAGVLGGQYKEARKTLEGINATIRETIAIRSDENKSFFTTLQLSRNYAKIAKERQQIEAKIQATIQGLRPAEKARVDRYAQLVQSTKNLNAQIEQNIQAANQQNQPAVVRARLLQQAAQLEQQLLAEEDERFKLLKDRKVAEIEVLNVSKQAIEDAHKLNEEYRKSERFWNNLVPKVQDLGRRLGKLDFIKGLGAGLGVSGGATAIFKSLVETAFAFDNSLTSIAKKSALTRDFTGELGKRYIEAKLSASTLNDYLDKSLLTTTSLLKAQGELQDASGQISLFDSKRVQDQLVLTKQYGLQAEEAAKLQQLSTINGKKTSETTDDIYEQVAQSNVLNKLRTSGLEVAKAVAKVEGVLAANYKNNPKLIAAAVAQAKALGMNLEQAAQASNSLLDFESSIANELEAELLTGKKWNLEKARALALDGDAAGAAREMLKNVGSLQEFEKQNVIAKQAQAKAVGMTVDELANSLRIQQVLKSSSQETSKAYNEILSSIKDASVRAKYKAELDSATNAKELQHREAIVSKQMEFESSMERVREAIGQMGSGPILKLVNAFASLTEHSAALKAILVGTAALMAAIATNSIITATALAFATGGATAIGGAIALGVGAAAGVAAATAVNDSLISPSGGIMISTPEGMIKPNKNDHVITTTDPGSLLNGGGNGKTDQLLSAILDAVKQPGAVYMDSTKVGTTLGVSYNAYA